MRMKMSDSLVPMASIAFLFILVVGLIAAVNAAAQAEELSRTTLNGSSTTDTGLTAVDLGTDTFLLDDRTFVMVTHDSDPSHAQGTATVTATAFDTQVRVTNFGELTISDVTATLAPSTVGSDSFIHLAQGGYKNDTGFAELTYSGDTDGLYVGVFRVPRP